MIAGTLILTVILCHILATRYYTSKSYLVGHLKGQDPEEIVHASRALILARSNGHIPSSNITVETTGIYVPAETIRTSSWIPSSIYALKPRYMKIRNDCVLIALNTPGRRTMLLTFRDGTEEFGTKKLADSLWYWNGRHRDKGYADSP